MYKFLYRITIFKYIVLKTLVKIDKAYFKINDNNYLTTATTKVNFCVKMDHRYAYYVLNMLKI
jgi:hypothetical protein